MGMFVIKRDGRKEPVKFDKITARINKLSYGLNPRFCDPVRAVVVGPWLVAKLGRRARGARGAGGAARGAPKQQCVPTMGARFLNARPPSPAGLDAQAPRRDRSPTPQRRCWSRKRWPPASTAA